MLGQVGGEGRHHTLALGSAFRQEEVSVEKRSPTSLSILAVSPRLRFFCLSATGRVEGNPMGQQVWEGPFRISAFLFTLLPQEYAHSSVPQEYAHDYQGITVRVKV